MKEKEYANAFVLFADLLMSKIEQFCFINRKSKKCILIFHKNLLCGNVDPQIDLYFKHFNFMCLHMFGL